MTFQFILLAVSAVWVASEVVLVFTRRSIAGSRKQDAGSLVRLNLIIYASVALAVCIGLSRFGRMNVAQPGLSWLGLFLIVSGLAIRWTAIFTLQQYFTVDVAILPDHRVIQKGLYKFVRHPSYLGSIVSFVGLGVAFCNWIAIAVVVVPVTLAFIKRIRIEERALVNALGEEYTNYCRVTRRLLPWIY